MQDIAGAIEMRASADALRGQAASLREVADGLRRRIQAMTFAGPAADRLRASSDAYRRQLEQASSELDRIAGDLLREADTIQNAARW